MDPILKYPGAKWRLAQWVIDHMPPHEGYLELFFGSGAVFFNKPKSRVETVNDLDGNVVRFFRLADGAKAYHSRARPPAHRMPLDKPGSASPPRYTIEFGGIVQNEHRNLRASPRHAPLLVQH